MSFRGKTDKTIKKYKLTLHSMKAYNCLCGHETLSSNQGDNCIHCRGNSRPGRRRTGSCHGFRKGRRSGMTEVANRFDDVWRVIEKNRNTYIAWLQELCRIPSVAAQSRGMEEAAAAVRRLLEGLALRQPVAGSRVHVMPTGRFPGVYGEYPGTADRTLLFYNLYGEQPDAPPELWPYSSL